MKKFSAIGAGFVGFGAVFAIFSYFLTENIPLTALGIAFVILGCVMLIMPEELVPHQVVRGMIFGSVANIEALLEEFAVTGRGIYLPQKEGRVYFYIPLSKNPSFPNVEEIMSAPKRMISYVGGVPALFIYPPGSDVVALSKVAEETAEEKQKRKRESGKDFALENFLPELESAINYCLVDFTEFSSKVQVSFAKNKVLLRMKNPKIEIEAPRFTRVLGSPPVSLVACCIAKISKMPVKILEERVERNWRVAVFEVGGYDG